MASKILLRGAAAIVCLASMLLLVVPAEADSVSWTGLAVAGEDPSFNVSGEIEWNVSGDQLVFTLQNLTALEQPSSGLALTGFVFNNLSGVTLTPLLAEIPAGSELLNLVADGSNPNIEAGDISGQWAAGGGKSVFGSTFDWAVGAAGDIDGGGADDRQLGTGEIIDPTKTEISPAPNGIDFAIVSDAGHANQGSFKKRGAFEPLVKDTVKITFSIASAEGTLLAGDITGVTPYFGTDGAALVPTPATLWSGLSLLCSLGVIGWFRGKMGRTV